MSCFVQALYIIRHLKHNGRSSDYFPETAKTVDELFLVLSEGSDQEARSVFVKECESQTQRILGTVSEFEEVLEKRHCWYEKNEDDEIDF